MLRVPHRGLLARVRVPSADHAKSRSISFGTQTQSSKPHVPLRWIASASTVLAGGLLFAQYQPVTDFDRSSLVQTSTPRHVSDAISRLDPERLLEGSQHHLRDLPLTTLFRSYFVYLACQSETLVSLAPKFIHALETARSTLPLGLGEVPWRVFAFVSFSSFDSRKSLIVRKGHAAYFLCTIRRWRNSTRSSAIYRKSAVERMRSYAQLVSRSGRACCASAWR